MLMNDQSQNTVIVQGPGVSLALSVTAWLLMFVLIALAIARPIVGYDSWWYHLPFSSMIWNIGGGSDNFHLDIILHDRFIGFPMLWETIQGLVWRLTGSLRLIVLPQIIFCLLYLRYIHDNFQIPSAWVIYGFFACPMLLIHFEATYVDLACGLAVALMFLGLTLLAADSQNNVARHPWRRAFGIVVMAAIAGNIKYQGLLACLALSALIMITTLIIPGIRTRSRIFVVVILLIANLAAATTVISNLVYHGNPFYPFTVQVFGRPIFDGPESPSGGAEPPSYLLSESREVSLPGPINFVLSATELDWVLRGVAPWYNVDAVSGRSPRRGPPSRTGGWGGTYFLINLGLLAFQAIRFHKLADQRQKALVLNTVLFFIITACLPRAHELRYWLYLPLVLMPVNLRFLRIQLGKDNVPIHIAILAVALYGIALSFLSPKSGLLAQTSIPTYGTRSDASPAMIEALAQTGRFCSDDPFLFRYSRAVTGLPGILSRRAGDCSGPER